MKCPSCGKELERMKRQVGTTESGDPIFNEYAVCRDCKKQWNLDRQRARKIAAKKEAEQAEAKPVDKAESKVAVRPAESSVSKKGAAEENPAAKKPPVKRPAAGSDAEKVKEAEKKAEAKPAKRRRPTDAEGKTVRPKASRPISNDETAEISEKPEKRPVKKKVRPASTEEPLSTKTPGEKKASAKKPVKKRHPEEASDTNKASDEQKYGNIPAEQVRTKREKAVRKGYEEMLATDPDSKFTKKKKKNEDPDEKKVKDTKKKEQYDDEYDDDEYEYDDVPRYHPWYPLTSRFRISDVQRIYTWTEQHLFRRFCYFRYGLCDSGTLHAGFSSAVFHHGESLYDLCIPCTNAVLSGKCRICIPETRKRTGTADCCRCKCCFRSHLTDSWYCLQRRRLLL